MGADAVTSTGAAKLFFGLLSLVAEFERGRISERISEGRKAKKAKGGLVGGPPPYGFSVEGRGKESMLVPNPAEQEPVRLILDLSREMRPYRVMKTLEQRGFRDRTGKPFNLMQIKRVVAYNTRQETN
jgi:DNA invertase Pin-like site-specific DNA recombinase